MNSYDQKYEFRIANKSDIEAIMQFIEDHWKSGHIMATSREFFEYEYLEEDGTVNFILAIDKEKGSIECLNGFLKASHDPEHLDIWGSIWKVLDGNKGMLGVEVIRRRCELTHSRCDLDVGDNPKTAIPVLKVLLKRHTAKMKHYYILADKSDFKIARVGYFPVVDMSSEEYPVLAFKTIDELKKRFNVEKYKDKTPYKDYWYLEHRFFNHPIYEYKIYGIEKAGEVDAIFVLRWQLHNDRAAIRFVDYIGDDERIKGIGTFLRKLLEDDERNEYIDFYCVGYNEKYIKEAGFTCLDENDENIIPNYFGPFLQENVDIWVDSARMDSVFTKADADQDRPNKV